MEQPGAPLVDSQGCRPGQVHSGQTPQAARLSTLGSSRPHKPTLYDHPMLNIRFHQNLSLSLLSSDAAKAEVLDF
jgi:hypothetical protein